MGWRDELREGSFRGTPFFIDVSQKTLGRRAILHEMPNREEPSSEDMGRNAETFEVEGHVVGDDYFVAKRALEKVFNKPGPGELIHPYYGSKFVQVGPVTISESNLEGAIAKFSAKFFEAGNNRFPKGVNDKGAILSQAISDATDSAAADFEDKFSIAGLPQYAVDSARDGVSLAQETFDKVSKIGGDVSDAIANLAFSTRNLVAEVNDLLASPDQLASRLLDSYGFLQDAFSGAEDQNTAFSVFFGFGNEDVSGDTPVRVQEKQNQDALNNFMRRVAAIKAAESASVAEYASFQDAEKAREDITAVIEEQIREDDGTDIFQKLSDVNAALVEALPDVDTDLPNLKEITLQSTTPSLLLTYDLFESIDNEQDIIDRNDIRHPGFIPANQVLEVLDG